MSAQGQPVRAAGAPSPLPKRVFTAARLVGPPPSIDGKLDDPCWKTAPAAGDFIQREPVEGAKPSEPTRLQILYDDRNVYVAIRAFDSAMASQPRLIGQRDEFTGDIVGVNFDTYHNQRTGFEFDLTSGGSKIDLILRNDGSVDTSWNAVWDGRVSVDAEGWSAEYRIPLSQLRYARRREQVWGLHAWRWIRRTQEESDWQLIPMDHQGMVYAFGELRGIADLPRSRRIELLPYARLAYQSPAREAGNPYRDGGTWEPDGGLDAKVGLSSDFTLDLTVNPDFGQVEADPSEMNLTTFETFFPERRPFFLEGKSIFDFALDDDQLFYSRRIGAAPSLWPQGAGYVEMPDNARILGAAKITGRTPGGFSLGILHSVTDRTEARLWQKPGPEHTVLAEPLTQFVLVRAQNEFDRGNTLFGGLAGLTLRDGEEEELQSLPRRAVAGGLDLYHYWNARSYYLDAKAVVTRVDGSSQAIAALLKDPIHNYARPDADHLELDENASSLSGNAGRIRVGKGNNGLWRYYGGVSWRSPGVEFNDLGYLMNADWVEQSAQVQYYDARPGTLLRRRDLRLRQANVYDYSGRVLERSLKLETEVAGLRNWYVWSRLGAEIDRLDTRMLRGGPAVRLDDLFHVDFYGETDSARPLQGKGELNVYSKPGDGSHSERVSPGIVYRAGDRLRFDFEVEYERNQQAGQYAGQTDVAGVRRYLVGRMDQHTVSSELRAQVTFTPTLSLTYFGGPFASVGHFDELRLVVRPRAGRFDERFSRLPTRKIDGGYESVWEGNRFEFDDPNFAWRELKSNLVLKWEFRAGSTLYCVWSQNRADTRRFSDFDGPGELGRLFESEADNTFLVKVSYWFSI